MLCTAGRSLSFHAWLFSRFAPDPIVARDPFPQPGSQPLELISHNGLQMSLSGTRKPGTHATLRCEVVFHFIS
ncbi:mCG1044118, isoform CRA_a [Mus musculus]|nr:mCG1044118, isoform CRA_a [Mus musculus]